MLSVRMAMVRREPASAVPGSDMHDSLVTLLFNECVSYTHYLKHMLEQTMGKQSYYVTQADSGPS